MVYHCATFEAFTALIRTNQDGPHVETGGYPVYVCLWEEVIHRGMPGRVDWQGTTTIQIPRGEEHQAWMVVTASYGNHLVQHLCPIHRWLRPSTETADERDVIIADSTATILESLNDRYGARIQKNVRLSETLPPGSFLVIPV